MAKPADLLQGTLDMLILKAVSLGPLHGYGILLRIQQISGDRLRDPAGLALSRALPAGAPGPDRGEWGEPTTTARPSSTRSRPPAAAGSGARPATGTGWRTPSPACSTTRRRSCDVLARFVRGAVLFRRARFERRWTTSCGSTSTVRGRSSRRADAATRRARRARAEFGSVDARKEECRETLGLRWWTSSRRPALRRADAAPHARRSRRSPFCASRSASAPTPRSSRLVDAVLLRALPVAEPERLVVVSSVDRARAGRQQLLLPAIPLPARARRRGGRMFAYARIDLNLSAGDLTDAPSRAARLRQLLLRPRRAAGDRPRIRAGGRGRRGAQLPLLADAVPRRSGDRRHASVLVNGLPLHRDRRGAAALLRRRSGKLARHLRPARHVRPPAVRRAAPAACRTTSGWP